MIAAALRHGAEHLESDDRVVEHKELFVKAGGSENQDQARGAVMKGRERTKRIDCSRLPLSWTNWRMEGDWAGGAD